MQANFQVCISVYTFKRQALKMVKHTQAIRHQFADELFECVWPFWGLDALRVKTLKGVLLQQNENTDFDAVLI